MKYIIALFLFVTSLHAADHVFFWTANPASENITHYNVWELIGPNWMIQGQPTTNGFTKTNVTSGTHTYALSAANAVGESPRSPNVIAIVPVLPTTPTNVIINLRASFQSSPDLTNWNNFLEVFVPAPVDQKQSYFRSRVDIEYTPTVVSAKTRLMPPSPWNIMP